MTRRRRNISLTFSPRVSAGGAYNPQITISTGGWSGETVNNAVANIDMDCARSLIRQLRLALRDTAKAVADHANLQHQLAEGPL